MNIIKEIKKPLSYQSIINSNFKRWKKNRVLKKIVWLERLSILWACVPFWAVIFYLYNIISPLEGISYIDYRNILGVILPTQASIVGIIIPIIFALVEQLFKGQDTIFRAFLYWSKVVQLTISSLLLVLFMSLQLALSIEPNFLAFYLLFLWFGLNIPPQFQRGFLWDVSFTSFPEFDLSNSRGSQSG